MKIKRKSYLDYLKAIAAIFVVVGHSLTFLEKYVETVPIWGRWISILVSSVHVPLFFLIAGYLCHKQDYRNYVKKKILRIIVPYITFSALKISFSLLVSSDYAHGANFGEILYDTFVLGGAYWFVYCMFLVYLLAPIVWNNNSETIRDYNIRILCIIIGLVIYNILCIDCKIYSFPEVLRVGNVWLQTPFFQIERVLMYFPYFAIGVLIKENDERIYSYLSKNKKYLSIISSLLIIIFGGLVVERIFQKGYIVKMGIAVPLMILLYYFVRSLPNDLHWFSYIGINSLHVMFFDSLYRVVLFAVISHICSPNTAISIFIAFATVFLACVSCLIIKKIKYVRNVFGL